ncbi:MAG: hypothetical protein RL557_324 [archaeon]|jgi:hypothetical protein
MAKPTDKKEEVTTIKVYRGTKERLNKLREYGRESYDEVLRKMFFIINSLKKDPQQAQKILDKIDSSIKTKEKYTEVYPEKKEKGSEKNGERK